MLFQHIFILLAIAARQIYAGDNLDLILFDNEDQCGGLSRICHDASYNVCCFVPDRLFGSASAGGGTTAGFSHIYTKRGNQYCGIQISPSQPIPVCIITGLIQSVGGIAAFRNNFARMERNQQAVEQVEAEPVFSTDTHHYIISHAKFSQLDEAEPSDAVSREAYFKKHADKVVERKVDQEMTVARAYDQ